MIGGFVEESIDARHPFEDADEDAVKMLPTVSAEEFCSAEPRPIEYLSKPSLVRGGMTVVYGPPKVGKTTLVAHLVHGVLDPSGHPFLDGTEALDGSVLWLDLDQPYRVSQRRFRDAGAHPELHIYRGSPPTMARLLATIDGRDFRCLVVDNLTRWLQLENENDNSELERKLGLYQFELQRRDVTSIIIDHAKKSDGPTGGTLRGGGHKLAVVDIAVEVKADGALRDGRRRLCFTSREEPHADLIVRLDGGRFVLEGSPYVIAVTGNEARIREGIRLGHQRKEALAEFLGVTPKTLEAWIKPMIDREIRVIRSPAVGRPIVYHLIVQEGTSQKSLGSSDIRNLL